jgi:CubicO group peptidase (beta-lactamase class C family)
VTKLQDSAEMLETVAKVAVDTQFSGVVRVDDPGGAVFERAYGLADRPHGIANTPTTRFAIASGAKGFTALTVMSLVVDGALELSATARSVLGSDLPLIRDDVTVEQLMAHRSGIGDYFDESAHDDIADYVVPISVHRLAETEDYLAVLDGFETAFEPGAQFAYCNGGFVVLALIAERVAGCPFRDLVRERVCEPAGLDATGYLRSDELPGDAAVGYLHADGLRSNVFHLPVRGSGDGGIYSTASDIRALWSAMFGGRIVPTDRVAQMVRPISDVPSEERRYGLGFWLHASADVAMLVGYDAGVSFWTAHAPASEATVTVISNTSEGAWDVVEVLYDHLPS